MAWDDGAHEALDAAELTFFTDPALDTAGSRHAAAVLLAHLRNIKFANGGHEQLNEAANN